jgi:hypothetical protein
MRKLLSVAAIAAIAVVAFVPAASAATKTTVKLDGAFLTNGASMWSGEVVSRKEKCAYKRVVLIFKQRPGADKKIGSAKAERVTGVVGYHWAFEKVGFAVKASETYYAKVKPTDDCSGARSPVRKAEVY